MDENVNKSIPVTFDVIEQIDSRFTKVKIWLMHVGENLNKSFFEKSVVENAVDSLKNNPILGFIEKNKDKKDDFSGHRNKVEKKDGIWKITYAGSAYGVIPENNSAKFEMKLCDDGIEREFLTCEGLIWNKWEEVTDILNRDLIKSQSMEIHDDFEGFFDENGVFHFTKFSFFGACILGKYVKPAMIGSTVEVQFSTDTVFEDIKAHLTEFEQIMKERLAFTQGGIGVNEKLELVKKYNFTVEQLAEANIILDSFSVLEDLENAIKEFASKASGSENTDGKTSDASPANVGETFATAQQLASELSLVLKTDGGTTADDWGYHMRNYYYVDHTDLVVIAESYTDGWKLVGMTYSMNGDKPVVDFSSKKRYKIEYVPMVDGSADSTQNFSSNERKEYELLVSKKVSEKEFSAQIESNKTKATESTAKFEEVNAKFTEVTTKFTEATEKLTSLESEATELRNFKKEIVGTKRKSDVDELFGKFTQLSEEDISEIKTEAYGSNVSIEDYETKLYAIVGRKFAQQSATTVKEKKKELKIGLINFGSTGSTEKEYADIIRKYSSK